ncbi:MAG: 50S ribosomal protein L11 methyltransferase [Clostridia bacterium]|nr:50S ribosomal protein L11 methyltransferase [Clostridia bacterium]
MMSQASEWLRLRFQTTHEASDLLAEYLRLLGADGVQIEDASEIKAILSDPASLAYADDGFVDQLSPDVQIFAFFALFDHGVRFCRQIDWLQGTAAVKAFGTQTELEALITTQLDQFREGLDIGTGLTGSDTVADSDWAENWKQYYETVHLTPRLVINPSWIDYEKQPDEIVVRMDPGSAFGTGTHETTAMCARLLDRLLRPGHQVLDLGTGSGILAIIAARLGAGSVEAIDIDPLAVHVACNNISDNHLDIACHTGELSDAFQPHYDLIVANIIADIIEQLMPELASRLAPQGTLIVSGIIAEKAAAIQRKAAACHLVCAETVTDHDWVAMVLRPVR